MFEKIKTMWNTVIFLLAIIFHIVSSNKIEPEKIDLSVGKIRELLISLISDYLMPKILAQSDPENSNYTVMESKLKIKSKLIQ